MAKKKMVVERHKEELYIGNIYISKKDLWWIDTGDLRITIKKVTLDDGLDGYIVKFADTMFMYTGDTILWFGNDYSNTIQFGGNLYKLIMHFSKGNAYMNITVTFPPM